MAILHAMANERDLALHRTFLALERTLVAWIRTCASFIDFGFAFYKFFEYLNEGDENSVVNNLVGPAQFAVATIALGMVTLLVATVHYRYVVQSLEKDGGEAYRSVAGLIASVVLLFGFGLLLVVLFRK